MNCGSFPWYFWHFCMLYSQMASYCYFIFYFLISSGVLGYFFSFPLHCEATYRVQILLHLLGIFCS